MTLIADLSPPANHFTDHLYPEQSPTRITRALPKPGIDWNNVDSSDSEMLKAIELRLVPSHAKLKVPVTAGLAADTCVIDGPF